jgi:DNA-binding response OmpR family regulator
VTEFALALAERGREPIDDRRLVQTDGQSLPHVLCVSAVASFLTVSRQLLAADRYGVTSIIGVPVTADQVASLNPNLVVLDAGSDTPQAIDLLRRLRHHTMTTQLPIVVTGRDRRRLEEIVAGIDDGATQQDVTLAPFDRDLRDLVATVASLTSANDADPAEAIPLQPTA